VAAGASAIFAGGITGAVTFLITNRQIRSAEVNAAAQRQHQLDMARVDRVVGAYTSIMQHMGLWSRWVRAATTRARKPGEDVVAPVIDRSREAFADLVTSDEVRDLISNFNELVRDFQVEWDWLLAEERSAPGDPRWPVRVEERKEHLGDIATALTQASDDIVQRMREEVGLVGRLPLSSLERQDV
jgi:hypothetical protein